MDMEKTNAVTPKTASGQPNVGLFVGFNLPVYHKKYQAGVCEAEERARADAKLYEAQRDETFSEIQDFMVQAKVQDNVLSLLRDSIEPRTRQTLELARSDYAKTNVDYATVLSALREVLQVQLQIAQVAAELGKALAGLERAVGRQINEGPTSSRPGPASDLAPARAPPPASSATSPFRGGESAQRAPAALTQTAGRYSHRRHSHERRRRREQARRLIERITEVWRHDALATNVHRSVHPSTEPRREQ